MVYNYKDDDVFHVLSKYPMCDAKNLTALVNDYCEYSLIEICFNIACIEESIKTGYEDSEGYVHEKKILDILSYPKSKYYYIPNLSTIIRKFLLEFISTSHHKPQKVIKALSCHLSSCSYDQLLYVIKQDYDNENDKTNDLYFHLLCIDQFFSIKDIMIEKLPLLTESEINKLIEELSELSYYVYNI
jgi:hypothetical protein